MEQIQLVGKADMNFESSCVSHVVDDVNYHPRNIHGQTPIDLTRDENMKSLLTSMENCCVIINEGCEVNVFFIE